MKLNCSSCGKPVSTEIPEETVVRASIECPECIRGSADNEDEIESRVWNEVIGLLKQAWPGKELVWSEPLELITRLIDERDEARRPKD